MNMDIMSAEEEVESIFGYWNKTDKNFKKQLRGLLLEIIRLKNTIKLEFNNYEGVVPESVYVMY